MIKALKIILIDENVTFRVALKSLLVQEYNAIIIGEALDAKEFKSLNNYNMCTFFVT